MERMRYPMAMTERPGLMTRLSLRILPMLLRASLRWTQRVLLMLWKLRSLETTPGQMTEEQAREAMSLERTLSPLTTMDTMTIEDLQSSIQQLITRLRSRPS